MSHTPATDAVVLAAKAAGKSWAVAVRAGFHADGRDVGMWPGTLSEARALAARIVGEYKTPEEEHEAVARTVYAAARSSWNAGQRSRRGGLEDPTDDG